MSGGKSIGALAGVAAAAMAASTLLAFATIDPPPLAVKQKKADSGASVAAPEAVAPKPDASASGATPAAPPPATPTPATTPPPSDSATAPPIVTTEALRARAAKNEISAMEELGRRLLQGTDAPKDPAAGAGWLLRAAGLGSAQSAFNVGVMYERGFVVERNSSKAAEWYRKAADAGIPAAKHNLALLLRDGKGTARDVKAATQLLLSAAHQGMAASMFILGDIYERGDGGAKDTAAALAWFAITGEFERQTNGGQESALAKTAGQRAQVLKRTLTTAELERAQELAQGEFKRIVATLTPPPAPPATPVAASAPATPAQIDNSAFDWPKGAADQVSATQQVLLDLKRLRDKPDGNLGPNTRAAIRDFQKSVGMRTTGEPSRDLYVALLSARHDIVAGSPLPTPPQTPLMSAAAPTAPPKVEPAQPQPPLPEAPPTPSSAEIAAAAPPAVAPPKAPDPPKPPPVIVDPTKPAPAKVVDAAPTPPVVIPLVSAPPPPTSTDIAKADPDIWPPSRVDQLKSIQRLLRDLRFYTAAIDGKASDGMQTAIRDYQRMSGVEETGEANKVLFEQLKEMRKLMAPAQN
jgi:TPR repeat protein/peptidoglycan hydrolase-like protein with peptidoglycan-binding domain